jgi:uncharacterized membrane protein (UPF0182 family)
MTMLDSMRLWKIFDPRRPGKHTARSSEVFGLNNVLALSYISLTTYPAMIACQDELKSMDFNIGDPVFKFDIIFYKTCEKFCAPRVTVIIVSVMLLILFVRRITG